ncbi:MAG TPA: AAA family ATPase [Oligoflexia bacterium]|nr:AAA family ATPase [Oligoflexia bacterium]HMP48368.1 AAA family ATPase [Oligoflexia bacterium]
MGVICFSSLKGGVGKTTLALNVAAALAERGGETLLIDLDPTAHTTRFFTHLRSSDSLGEAPLARLLLAPGVPQGNGLVSSGATYHSSSGSDYEMRNGKLAEGESVGVESTVIEVASRSNSLVDFSAKSKIPLLREVRKNLVLLPGGAELRHFLWGKGANLFKLLFSRLIRELKPSFDYIIIDTPPDFSVLVRNALAISDLVVVPVDGSAMSIDCLNQLVLDASHIKGPEWCIVRSMVSKQASKLRKISEDRIKQNLSVREFDEGAEENNQSSEFLDFIEEVTDGTTYLENGKFDSKNEHDSSQSNNPIYLLDSMVYRSEEQNKLSFSKKTAFESSQSQKLAMQYKCLARELDALLMLREREGHNLEDESEKVFDFAKLSASQEFSANR